MIESINNFLSQFQDIQAIIVISVVSVIGLALGKIKIFGISLGVTFVFFVGIFAGHLLIDIDHQMLRYAESLGLVIFVYALGLQVGPGFFSSFRKGGVQLNLLSLVLIIAGALLSLGLIPLTRISLLDMVGVMCGATTNTPALAAAQQTLQQLGMDTSGAALSCAVTYPLGVVGVILALALVRKFVKDDRVKCRTNDNANTAYICEFRINNDGIDNKKICDISQISHRKFVISRLWRDGEVFIPTFDMVLKKNDHILVITNEEDVPSLTMLFGEQEKKDWNNSNIDWNKIDSQLISQRFVITNREINGKHLGDLKLRNHFGVNITRVYRAGVQLLATPDLILQLGDKLTVVGEKAALKNVESVLGNVIKSLKEPNLIIIFIGIILGLLIGIIPIPVPGVDTTIRLGLAGGPIVSGILIGAFGPRFHMITYTTRSVNLMLRAFGLAVYLACLGIDSGAHFFETVVCANGLLWIGAGFLITFVPVVLILIILVKFTKTDYGLITGMICGSMANPMALDYLNDNIEGDNASVAYATVYPMSMFARVIIAQLLLILLL